MFKKLKQENMPAGNKGAAQHLSSVGIFLLLMLITLLARLPYFFHDVIDWDESVFILVGKALTEGHLPYTLVWDNKPPLIFVFFALVQSMLPDSLAFVRFSGAVLVAISAFIVFRISLIFVAVQEAFFAATLFIVSVSVLINSGQAVMSEHIALVPMLLAMLLLVKTDQLSKKRLLLVGVLLGTATMVRTNLAYLLLATTVLVPLIDTNQRFRERVITAALIAAGAWTVFLSILLVYVISNQSQVLIKSAILVPLAYSKAGLGLLDAALAMLRSSILPDNLNFISKPKEILRLYFWVTGLIGLVYFVFVKNYRTRATRVVLIFFVSILFSVLSSGYPWGHYLIQLAPFFAVGAGCFLLFFPIVSKFLIVPVAVCVLGIGLFLFQFPFYQSFRHADVDQVPVYSGVSFELADYLNAMSGPSDTFFVYQDILLYWLMDKYPVHPVAAFPANLWMEQGILKPLYGPEMTTDALLKEITSMAPTRIILPIGVSGTEIRGDRTFPVKFLKDYDLETTVANRLIYRKKL